MSEPVLTAERVEELHRACLAPASEDGIEVAGIVSSACYSPAAIEAHRAEIRALLGELPEQFHKAGGGGWSFLNACLDRDDRQWTGLHLRMEELFMLGIAAGLVTDLMGREMWDALPGGMPYYLVDL